MDQILTGKSHKIPTLPSLVIAHNSFKPSSTMCSAVVLVQDFYPEHTTGSVVQSAKGLFFFKKRRSRLQNMRIKLSTSQAL